MNAPSGNRLRRLAELSRRILGKRRRGASPGATVAEEHPRRESGALQRRRASPSGATSTAEQLLLPWADFEAKPQKPDTAWLQSVADQILARHAPDLWLPPVRVSGRMTRTFGTFNTTTGQISLSARLVAFGSVQECRRILLHEVAHAIVHHREPGAKAHGSTFRAVCRELGVDGARLVDLPVAGWTKRERFAYRCHRCRSTQLRKRALRRIRCACGTPLAPRRVARVAVAEDGATTVIAHVDLSRR